MRHPAAVIPLAALLGVAACTGGPEPASFDSDLSQARIDAIATAPDDEATERALVEQLDADDGAVRMLAITRLQLMRGETLGYDFAASRAAREAAVLRWVEQEQGATEAAP